MPNWCENDLYVRGETPDLEAFCCKSLASSRGKSRRSDLAHERADQQARSWSVLPARQPEWRIRG